MNSKFFKNKNYIEMFELSFSYLLLYVYVWKTKWYFETCGSSGSNDSIRAQFPVISWLGCCCVSINLRQDFPLSSNQHPQAYISLAFSQGEKERFSLSVGPKRQSWVSLVLIGQSVTQWLWPGAGPVLTDQGLVTCPSLCSRRWFLIELIPSTEW